MDYSDSMSSPGWGDMRNQPGAPSSPICPPVSPTHTPDDPAYNPYGRSAVDYGVDGNIYNHGYGGSTSPHYSEASPSYSQTSPPKGIASNPAYSPSSSRYSPNDPPNGGARQSHAYSPTDPNFVPRSPRYSPASPHFSPLDKTLAEQACSAHYEPTGPDMNARDPPLDYGEPSFPTLDAATSVQSPAYSLSPPRVDMSAITPEGGVSDGEASYDEDGYSQERVATPLPRNSSTSSTSLLPTHSDALVKSDIARGKSIEKIKEEIRKLEHQAEELRDLQAYWARLEETGQSGTHRHILGDVISAPQPRFPSNPRLAYDNDYNIENEEDCPDNYPAAYQNTLDPDFDINDIVSNEPHDYYPTEHTLANFSPLLRTPSPPPSPHVERVHIHDGVLGRTELGYTYEEDDHYDEVQESGDGQQSDQSNDASSQTLHYTDFARLYREEERSSPQPGSDSVETDPDVRAELLASQIGQNEDILNEHGDCSDVNDLLDYEDFEEGVTQPSFLYHMASFSDEEKSEDENYGHYREEEIVAAPAALSATDANQPILEITVQSSDEDDDDEAYDNHPDPTLAHGDLADYEESHEQPRNLCIDYAEHGEGRSLTSDEPLDNVSEDTWETIDEELQDFVSHDGQGPIVYDDFLDEDDSKEEFHPQPGPTSSQEESVDPQDSDDYDEDDPFGAGFEDMYEHMYGRDGNGGRASEMAAAYGHNDNVEDFIDNEAEEAETSESESESNELDDCSDYSDMDDFIDDEAIDNEDPDSGSGPGDYYESPRSDSHAHLANEGLSAVLDASGSESSSAESSPSPRRPVRHPVPAYVQPYVHDVDEQDAWHTQPEKDDVEDKDEFMLGLPDYEDMSDGIRAGANETHVGYFAAPLEPISARYNLIYRSNAPSPLAPTPQGRKRRLADMNLDFDIHESPIQVSEAKRQRIATNTDGTIIGEGWPGFKPGNRQPQPAQPPPLIQTINVARREFTDVHPSRRPLLEITPRTLARRDMSGGSFQTTHGTMRRERPRQARRVPNPLVGTNYTRDPQHHLSVQPRQSGSSIGSAGLTQDRHVSALRRLHQKNPREGWNRALDDLQYHEEMEATHYEAMEEQREESEKNDDGDEGTNWDKVCDSYAGENQSMARDMRAGDAYGRLT